LQAQFVDEQSLRELTDNSLWFCLISLLETQKCTSTNTHTQSKGYQRLILHSHKSGKNGADFDQTYFKCVQLLQEIAASSTKEMNEKPSRNHITISKQTRDKTLHKKFFLKEIIRKTQPTTKKVHMTALFSLKWSSTVTCKETNTES
jgi:hypothetical protein